jgi:glycosyltransferase involved in cell wall biosynthesis
MGEAKGCYDLLEAVARLVPRFPGLRLVMAGDGEIDKVRLAAKALGLSASVELHDWVSGDEKRALLRSAAAFVLPSYCEGMPMSVLESMAVGMPVVTTSVGGIPELVTDGVEGRLVAAGDIDALSEAIETLLSSHDLRRQMGIAARRKVEEMFSDAGILPQLERLYRELGVEPCLR